MPFILKQSACVFRNVLFRVTVRFSILGTVILLSIIKYSQSIIVTLHSGPPHTPYGVFPQI